MSILGPIDDSDYRRWQRHSLTALANVLDLGILLKLPPLSWRLPRIGALVGEVVGIDHPRDAFETWHLALVGTMWVSPRILPDRSDDTHRTERTADGRTQLYAAFTVRMPDKDVDLALMAEWYSEDLAGAR